MSVPTFPAISTSRTSPAGDAATYWTGRMIEIDLIAQVITAKLDGYISQATHDAGDQPLLPGVVIQIPSSDSNYAAILNSSTPLSTLSGVASSYF